MVGFFMVVITGRYPHLTASATICQQNANPAIHTTKPPSLTKWYGDAAHIIPHSGADKNGKKLYGASVLPNGLFLSKLHHWCFDEGWFTLSPIVKGGRIEEYKVDVATVVVDEVFEAEASHLLKLDGVRLTGSSLPANPNQWPSSEALAWHRENKYHG